MSNDEKKVREFATCIKTILKGRGVEVKAKDIVELIKDEALDDPIALSQKVENDFKAATPVVQTTGNSRRKVVGDWMVNNFDSFRDVPEVLSLLLSGYTRGRISKEVAAKLQDELLRRCKGETTDTPEVATVQADDEGAELVDGANLDF